MCFRPEAAGRRAGVLATALRFCGQRGGGGALGSAPGGKVSQFRSFSQFFAISRNFTIFRQSLFACPPRVRVGALRVPGAEVVLFEASGGLVTAPQFSRSFPQFPAFFRNRI